jgi:mannose-6-phosphate isomerase-like protein (cupin superfamily)
MAQAGQTIENIATAERIVFRKYAADTDGKLLEFDDFWTRRGHRAPAHIHPAMEERWLVIAGTAAFRIGDVEVDRPRR